MPVIGITGNIATGKSTVARILEELGARVLDADEVAHSVLEQGTQAWHAAVKAFGPEILLPDGSIDRRKLGSIVFADAAKLKTLERITHPAIGAELARLVREAQEPIVFIEAVKLFEAGMHEFMDGLWVVTAPRAEQKRRLTLERGMSEADAEARLRSQPLLEEKLARANVVIDNGGSLANTREQVLRAFAALDPTRGRDKNILFERWLERTPHAQA
jgi:dephospho-CoA kinase